MPPAIEPLWKARLGQTVAFSRDSKLLAVGGAHGPVRLLKAQTGKLAAVCEGSKSDIYKIAFSKDGKLIAIGELDKRVTICDATTAKLVGKLKVDNSEIKNLQFSSETDHLIRAARKSEIEVFETTSLQACMGIKPDPAVRLLLTAFFSPDGENLFAVYNTNSPKQMVSVAYFSWPDAKRIDSATLDVELVYDAAISGDGRLLALSFSSYSPPQMGVALLDAKTCAPMHAVLTHEICAVIFVPSRSLLIASDAEDHVECCRLIDPQSGKELGRFEVGTRRIFNFDVSADDRYLAAATSGGAMVWDLEAILSTFGVS